MVELLNTAQPIRTGIFYPRGVASRVLTLELIVPAGIGNGDWNYTPVLGNELWILSADLWICTINVVGAAGAFFQLSTGMGTTVVAGMVILDWDTLVPHSGIKPYPACWWVYDLHLHFDMNRHFSGQSRRLGAWFGNLSATAEIRVLVSFQISEG